MQQFLTNSIEKSGGGGQLSPIYTDVKFPLGHYQGKTKLHIAFTQIINFSRWKLATHKSYQIKITKSGFETVAK